MKLSLDASLRWHDVHIRIKRILLLSVAFLFFSSETIALPLQQLQLPSGFTIDVFATIPGARQMAQGEKGTVFVGSREAGNVYAIVPDQNFKKAAKIVTIAKNLNSPNGVAFHKGSLYVAEINRILRFDNIENSLNSLPQPVVVRDDLPTEEHHGWRYIKFGPDGKLYVAIGAPCNICLKKDPRYASIVRMNPDDSHFEIFASGIRNSVGFDWHPVTKKLWFTDNGTDWMGDDFPPDELNYAPHSGMHFGFPYYHGNNVPDPRFGKLKPASECQPPAILLGPHVAALGMTFYNPNQILIAEHGSWNRTKKIGYQISLVNLKDDKAISYQPWITGWLNNEMVWGRPVDILRLQNGSLLISDDYAGVIYRVSVIPAKAGIHTLKTMDSRLRRNDGKV